MKKLLNVLLVLTMLFSVLSITVVDTIADEKKATVTVKSQAGSAKNVYVAKGKKVKLTASVKNGRKVTYKSANKKIAMVNKKGVVTGKKAGKTKITVKVKNKKLKAVIKVIVMKSAVKKVRLNKNNISLTTGNTYKLKANISPKNKVYKKVKWTSSDNSVATVNEKGVVTAVKEGNTVVRARALDGSGKKAKCTVKVKAPSIPTTTPTPSDTVQGIISAKTINFYTVEVKFDKAYDLTKQDFVLQTYNSKDKTETIVKEFEMTTNDKQTYTLKVSLYADTIKAGEVYRISVNKVAGTKNCVAEFLSEELARLGNTIKYEQSYSVCYRLGTLIYCDIGKKEQISNITENIPGVNVIEEDGNYYLFGTPFVKGKYPVILEYKTQSFYEVEEVSINEVEEMSINIVDKGEYFVDARDSNYVYTVNNSMSRKVRDLIDAYYVNQISIVSVTGLPEGLTYKKDSESIEGTPTTIGIYDVELKILIDGKYEEAVVTKFCINPEIKILTKDKIEISTVCGYIDAKNLKKNGTIQVTDEFEFGKNVVLVDNNAKIGIYEVDIEKNVTSIDINTDYVLVDLDLLKYDFGDNKIWYDKDNVNIGYGNSLLLKSGETYMIESIVSSNNNPFEQFIISAEIITGNTSIDSFRDFELTAVREEDIIKGTLSLDTPMYCLTGRGYIIYEFTPIETGDYKFYTTGDVDTCGILCNSDKLKISESGEYGFINNFCIESELEAGKKYYIAIKEYNNQESKNTKVLVSKVKN